MVSESFRSFLTSHTERIEPLSRDLHLAYWRATISGAGGDYRHFTELDFEYQKIYADRDEFDRVRRWRQDGTVVGEIEQRALIF